MVECLLNEELFKGYIVYVSRVHSLDINQLPKTYTYMPSFLNHFNQNLVHNAARR